MSEPRRGRESRAAAAGQVAGGGAFDTAAMTELWDMALNAPGWDRPPVWFHGDFHTGNLLTVDGRLSAVIDFGGLGLGDPACDLTIAFTLMSARSRAAFRATLGVDDATWARGRGIAFRCDVARGLAGWHTMALLWLTVPDTDLRTVGRRMAGWPESRRTAGASR
ncbi:phosphotransferase [Microtetraspora malaysiensis]|uniref:Phosphotransferase n=1 Tax=Microtetraspora malaysiensis TaxID=161358 RepID=A0ABW6T2S6_9ACTN